MWKRVIIYLRVDLYDDLEAIVIRNSHIDILKVCSQFDFWRIRNGSKNMDAIGLFNPYWQIMENSSIYFSEIFIFPGRHTGRFTGKLIHSNFLTETIYDT